MRRWRHWSVRRRVVTVSALALLAVITIGVIGFFVALQNVVARAALSSASTQANQTAGVIDSGDIAAVDVVDRLPGQGSLVQVLNAEGEVIASSDRDADDHVTDLRPAVGQTLEEVVTELDEAPDEHEADRYAVAAVGVRDSTGQVVTVVVAKPLTEILSIARTAAILLGVGAVVLLSLLLVLIAKVVDGALAPVARIRGEVSRIERAGSADRVTVPDTNDEIARLAETMNAMLDRLHRADSATRQFVSDASHELRSPLATIRAAVETSRHTDATSLQQRDQVLLGEALRMQALVEGLLTLAKADDQGLPLTWEEVDVDDLAYAEVRRLRAAAEVPVTAHIEAGRVRGDRARLAQVVRNLTDNAVRHTTGGVTLMVRTDGAEVVIDADNEGAPIPDAERVRVFDRFYRVDSSRGRDSGGSGLGLAIVATIVHAHGGVVLATQTPSGDCRFEVRLPASVVGGEADSPTSARSR